ncbi:Zinc finger and BTB domain-containing protein 37 [Nibea albiflora]|uniref:Zinc finger and BTB domain-containing protein 37 n=1 Tax=Nibea albiflora TaxID=240163 RepID=A0ACB7EM73_NIBAL|nr:Zinc finger and BTB domain-containing protein 37 [Nibea albiflora]
MERSGSIQLEHPRLQYSVLSHLNQLRVQGRLCDIVVNVQGQSFRAHKVVLAASSPYFRGPHVSEPDEHRVADGDPKPDRVRAAAVVLLHGPALPAARRHHQLPDGRQLPADAAHHRPLHADPGGDPPEDQPRGHGRGSGGGGAGPPGGPWKPWCEEAPTAACGCSEHEG